MILRNISLSFHNLGWFPIEKNPLISIVYTQKNQRFRVWPLNKIFKKMPLDICLNRSLLRPPSSRFSFTVCTDSCFRRPAMITILSCASLVAHPPEFVLLTPWVCYTLWFVPRATDSKEHVNSIHSLVQTSRDVHGNSNHGHPYVGMDTVGVHANVRVSIKWLLLSLRVRFCFAFRYENVDLVIIIFVEVLIFESCLKLFSRRRVTRRVWNGRLGRKETEGEAVRLNREGSASPDWTASQCSVKADSHSKYNMTTYRRAVPWSHGRGGITRPTRGLYQNHMGGIVRGEYNMTIDIRAI